MLLLSFYLSSPIQLAHRMALGLLALDFNFEKELTI